MRVPFLKWRTRKPKAEPPCRKTGEAPATYVAPVTAAALLERYAKGERLFPGLTPQIGSLRDAKLLGISAPGAQLSGLDLTGADLSGANLERAVLDGCILTGANLNGACLRDASLIRAVLHGTEEGTRFHAATLVGADLTYATIHGANFEGCDLLDATLLGVKGSDQTVVFDAANLRGVALGNASLRGASFRGASLQGAQLKGADLSGADYRQALGGRFDETRTDRMAYASTFRGFLLASPLWLQLRSAYTGVWMVVHLALLTLFVLPHAGEAVMWRAGSSAQHFARQTLSDSAVLALIPRDTTSILSAEYRELRDSVTRDVVLGMKRALIDSTVPPDLCVNRDAKECQPLRIWQILLGWNASWWVRIGLIFAYVANLLRLALTLGVSSLRDKEAMSGLSPTAGACRVMGVGHWIFRLLVLYVASAAVISLVRFLKQPVWLPQ